MSWNNVLPWWIYELQYEHTLASMSCAFKEEWFSGTSKVMPDHAIDLSRSNFKSWNPGGWNYELQKELNG